MNSNAATTRSTLRIRSDHIFDDTPMKLPRITSATTRFAAAPARART
jgi:hypothetical protein